ncbi:acyltransferase [Brevundimonas sp.]|uniref:acyltransferase n=1 Tax=Brevundimonas sp. TaxID=1871086 RepID=UPI002FC64456
MSGTELREGSHQPALLQSGIRNCTFGAGVKIVEPANVYGADIGEGTFIGPFVEIQKDVVIGARCKIQSHSFICELVTIGDDTVIAHGVMFINDLFQTGGPANGDKALWRSTRIGSRVAIGSNATILPVEIVDGCVIGAGSVVTRDCKVKGIYAGNPARLVRALD